MSPADRARDEPALRARGLVKHFGTVHAVDGLDLEVARGTCLAMLGPNGAGKTTTIEMLEGLLAPDAGEVRVLGRSWADGATEIRARIGVQLQETRLQEKLTARETVRMFRSFYREGRSVEQSLDLVGLLEKADARIENLSGGQHQRLALACALCNRPELLFLDEPTTGLDPAARRRVWEVVEDFKASGGTVLLTTHYMEEAQRLSDEVVIVDAGRVIAQGTPAQVIGRLEAESIVVLAPRGGPDQPGLEPEVLGALEGVRAVRREGAGLTLSVNSTQTAIHALLGHLGRSGLELEALETHAPTLEDVFMDLTGRHLRDG